MKLNHNYIKVTNGEPQLAEFAPSTITKVIVNPSRECYAENGYYPIRSTEPPEDREGFEIVSSYEYDDEKKEVVQTWGYVELPALIPDELTEEDNDGNA